MTHDVPRVVERVAVCIADFPNLGDHLALLPLYHGLSRRFPGCRILVASRYERVEIARAHGFIDEVTLYRRADRRLLRRIRAFAPDVSIGLRRRSLRAGWCFGRPSGAALTVGLPGPGNALLYHRLAENREHVYRPFRNLAPLEALGGAGDLPGSVRRLAAGSSWPPPAPSYGVVVPGGAIDDKLWGADRFARVAARLDLADGPMPWLAVLGPNELERGDGERLRAAMPDIAMLESPPLEDLARILFEARLVLANDCGPGHLAQMAGTPLVQVFGNWDGEVDDRLAGWFDARPGSIAVTTVRVAPIDDVPEAEVASAARELLANPATGGRVVRCAA